MHHPENADAGCETMLCSVVGHCNELFVFTADIVDTQPFGGSLSAGTDP